MYITVSLNLDIQRHYFLILQDFLDSEYTAMEYGEMSSVLMLEKSIHGLLESIRAKREDLATMLEGLSVLEYASELPGELGKTLREKFTELASVERLCAESASRNSTYAFTQAEENEGLMAVLAGDADTTAAAFKGRVQ